MNEALSDSPAGAFADNLWLQAIGPEYFFLAFSAATEAVKKNNLAVKLYYNDYNIEYPGNKSTAAQSLVSQLKARGITIDGVGLESHVRVVMSLSRSPIFSLLDPRPFLLAVPQCVTLGTEAQIPDAEQFIAGQTPSQADQEANMNAFAALDVDLVVTELDVRLPSLPPNATSQAQQVIDYYNSVSACVNMARCVGITIWDFDGE